MFHWRMKGLLDQTHVEYINASSILRNGQKGRGTELEAEIPGNPRDLMLNKEKDKRVCE